jgi:hypothetical protein
MAGSLGKMPTTLVPRLISALKSLERVGAMDLRPMRLGEPHEGEHLALGVVHQPGEFRELRTQLIGHGSPLFFLWLGI